ncbi:MAG: DUF1826 domain-containing protein [Idiomarina sp.]|nr:DUF1826 domain-containing protein [Idiomarina sp.]
MKSSSHIASQHSPYVRFERDDHVAAGIDHLVLPEVLNEHINLAIWQRALPHEVTTYAQFLQRTQWPQQRFLTTAQNVADILSDALPSDSASAATRTAFIRDVALLAEMYSCLFDVQDVGIRLARLSTAMCPKFHTDKLGCRLITTYAGLGTEWLANDVIQRTTSGKVMTSVDAPVQHLNAGDVALFKGDGWADAAFGGIVHRSPAVPESDARVVLTIDGF